jgi:hypothetical protein
MLSTGKLRGLIQAGLVNIKYRTIYPASCPLSLNFRQVGHSGPGISCVYEMVVVVHWTRAEKKEYH